jgi:NDP-sugar pyrophosphorylase family protein
MSSSLSMRVRVLFLTKPTSIEEVFPRITADTGLFALVLSRFWTPYACTYYITDAGMRLDSLQPQEYITDACSPWQPRDYITGLCLYLDSLRKKVPDKLASGAHALGNMLVKETAVIGEGCLIEHACVAAVLPLSVSEGAETERRNRAVGGASVFRKRRGGGVAWRRNSVAWRRPMGRRR